MTPNDENDSVLWVRELAAGNEVVMQEFWREYAPSLQRLANSRMTPALQRRVGADDVVQSVCRTFLRRAQKGEFTLEASDGLWRLLCAITLTKVRQHARFHFRQKRGLDREISLESAASSSDGGAYEAPAPEGLSPADALAFADQMSSLLSNLNDEERKIVDGKLEGLTNSEIAMQLQCSERTVRRLLARIEKRWSRELGASLGRDFAGGELRVRISEGARQGDRLVIGAGFIVDANNNVVQGTALIGRRIADGISSKELTVTFNANATKEVIRQLVSAISLQTAHGSTGLRRIAFTVSDGGGSLSPEVRRDVNVR